MILVFGSLNMDFILQVEHLPEPGETVLTPEHATAPGGKGANQAVAAARAGGDVAMAGCVGPDDYGRELTAIMTGEGIDMSRVATATRPTALAVVTVDREGANQIVVSSGANREARQACVGDDVLGAATTLLLQREVPVDECAALARRARNAGVRVILNAAPAGPVECDALDFLIVNEVEAQAVARESGLEGLAPVDLAHHLARHDGVTTVVTLGERGAIAVGPGETWRIGSLVIRPVDTVGAGDAFCGTLAAALDMDMPLPRALRRASVAGALACLEPGAMPALPCSEAVDARLEELAPAVAV